MLIPQHQKQRQNNTKIAFLKSMSIALSTILLLGAFGTLLFVNLQHPQTNNGRELSAADWDALGRYRGVSLRAGPYNLAEVAELQTHLDHTSAHDINQQLMFLKKIALIGPLNDRQQQLEKLLQDNYDRRLQMDEASTYAPNSPKQSQRTPLLSALQMEEAMTDDEDDSCPPLETAPPSPVSQPLLHSPAQSQPVSILFDMAQAQFKDAESMFANGQVTDTSALLWRARFINQQVVLLHDQCPDVTLSGDYLASLQRAQYYLKHQENEYIMNAASTKVYVSEQAHERAFYNFQNAQKLFIESTKPGKEHKIGSAQHMHLVTSSKLWVAQANQHYIPR